MMVGKGKQPKTQPRTMLAGNPERGLRPNTRYVPTSVKYRLPDWYRNTNREYPRDYSQDTISTQYAAVFSPVVRPGRSQVTYRRTCDGRNVDTVSFGHLQKHHRNQVHFGLPFHPGKSFFSAYLEAPPECIWTPCFVCTISSDPPFITGITFQTHPR